MSVLRFLGINHLPDTRFAAIFSSSVARLFLLSMVSFAVQLLV